MASAPRPGTPAGAVDANPGLLVLDWQIQNKPNPLVRIYLFHSAILRLSAKFHSVEMCEAIQHHVVKKQESPILHSEIVVFVEDFGR